MTEAIDMGPEQIRRKDLFAETSLLLGRVATIEDEDSRQDAIDHVTALLKIENLASPKENEEPGMNYHFEILSLLPPLHKLDARVAEKKIVEFATAEPYIKNEEFTNELIEVVAEIRAATPLVELPSLESRTYRAQADMDIHKMRHAMYPAA